MLKLIFFTFTCYIAVVWTYTPPNFFRKVHHQGRAYQDAVSEHRAYEALYGLNRQNITVNFLDQPIDHANPSLGTFQQQYWIDSTSVDLTTDIAFLYINGEAPGSSMSGYPLLLATEFKALACALEHRFYGKSMPSALTNHTVLPYLTVDNALADLIAFMEYVETSIMKKRLRWVSVGGSYAGALSAWLKVRYNDRLVAAWSSSGVVEAKFDFTFFDGHIAQVLPDRCLQKTKLVLLTWEQLYDDPASCAQLMQMFGTPSYFTKTEMAWALTDGISQMIQYGRKTVWCDAMESSEYAMKLLEAARDVIAKYFTLDVMSECSYSTACMTNEQMSDQWGPSGYAWIYQTCSELAYWQVAYPHSIRPQIITSDFFINQCHAVFGESTFPDVFRFNEKYGGARPFADHVISLQGSDDPWMEVGVRTSLSDTYIVNVAECENCGHCGDLSYPSSNDPSELQKQRELIRQILIQWLHISK